MTTPFTLRATLLALCLAIAATASAARSSVPMRELGRQEIVTMDGQPLALDAMRKAILYGGLTRRWTAVGEQPGVLSLQASNGGHIVVVDVAYDAKSYEIRYKSSVEMGYDTVDGKPVIHPKYNQWVNDLSTAIRAAVRTGNGERY
ncbi:hypothetical protein [Scleromatobacter humisilvae]|uniref:Lipoprotein n=1 Tax=Scleromatobacter humisilvae TaxID=2897159 RepID=A0A9X1YGK3_9BURK|nr:hypothetical protein [Scleromatobacter humisilvae]MCK9684283.1 hypothetical protein [Scleromatobacter humisilvae]